MATISITFCKKEGPYQGPPLRQLLDPPALMDALKLCYVENGIAYFTTAELGDQTGDDWEDKPYQHNAGPPYEWRPSMLEWRLGADLPHGISYYQLACCRFTGPFLEPKDFYESWISVDEINQYRIPWVKTNEFVDNAISIYAGTTPLDFYKAIHDVGGQLWISSKHDLKSEYPWLIPGGDANNPGSFRS